MTMQGHLKTRHCPLHWHKGAVNVCGCPVKSGATLRANVIVVDECAVTGWNSRLLIKKMLSMFHILGICVRWNPFHQ